MLSVLVLLTCACAASSAFVAPEQRNIKPTDVAVWRNTVKLNASYLDGLSGGDKAPPPKQATYSPFKKNPSKPVSDHLQPYFNEAKDAAAEAIGQPLEEKVSAEEATETSPTEDKSFSSAPVETSYEPPAVVTPEPAAIATTDLSEMLYFGPAQMPPNSAIMHGETDPTIPGGEFDPTVPVVAAETTTTAAAEAVVPLDQSPKDRDYLEETVDGPSNLNFRYSFAPYPKKYSSMGRGSYSSYSQAWTK